MEGKELYFAFASNLSERKMKERGAKFTSRESAVLRGYRFVFNTNWKDDGFGYANRDLKIRGRRQQRMRR